MKSDPEITADQAQRIYRKLCVGRALVLASYTGLLLLFSSWNIIDPQGGIKLWLVQCLPLLIFVPGLWQDRQRTYSWLCFVILLYFTWSVTNVMSPLGFWRDWLVLGLSVTLFVAAMMTSRWLQYWRLWQSRQAQ